MANRILRLTEATPEALLEVQTRYAALRRDYRTLAASHAALLQRFHDLLAAYQRGGEPELQGALMALYDEMFNDG